MLFDLYAPTRTSDGLEVRMRSASAGPIALALADSAVDLGPIGEHRGVHFYRHRFEGLACGASFPVRARHLESGATASQVTSTLPSPPGATRLRLGLVADPHLSTVSASIDDYATGTRRLYGLAGELMEKYLPRVESLGVDAIVLLGDLVDPCTPETLARLRVILSRVSVPCHPIIGNHEPWSPGGEELFHRALGLPSGGHRVLSVNGVRLIFLSTPDPGALSPGSEQLRWLERQLADAPSGEDIALFSHFSLLLHPCVQGHRNDGYQLLDNHRALLALLARHPRVRVFAAGHKNVPSRVDRQGVVHLLSPQLIQAPCGYDVLTFYEGGLGRVTYEIDEQHYCEVARAAYQPFWRERYGQESHRNFVLRYDESAASGLR
jgi:hypothetical protein